MRTFSLFNFEDQKRLFRDAEVRFVGNASVVM